MRGVIDTSVLIADEQGRSLQIDRLPDEIAISVITLAELELGVHLAADERARARRLATLRATQANYVALSIDEPVAAVFAEIVATARRDGRRPNAQDVWIAATARVHGAAVYTQDAGFEGLAGVDVVLV